MIMMRFAIISDIHLGLENQYQNVPSDKNIKSYLNNFVEEMNINVKPEFVIVLGDLIEDFNKINDQININYITNLFQKLKCAVYYVAGNHDLKNISKMEFVKIVEQNNLYYSFDKNNFHFIVLFSEETKDTESFISNKQMDWLKTDLSKTNKQSIVFVHHCLSNQNLTGNPWFKGMPKKCLVSNRDEVREIISSSNKVIAVFNGHLHWNKKNTHRDIPYFTINSLSDNANEKKIASEAYAVVNIENDTINVDVKGNYPKKLQNK